jgi:acetoacetyl-CoA synthetase
MVHATVLAIIGAMDHETPHQSGPVGASMPDAPLWQPSQAQIRSANLTRFMAQVGDDWSVTIADYDALHAFSLAEPDKFWHSVIDFCGLVAESWGLRALVDGDKMPGAVWFPDAKLNFAENLLNLRGSDEAMVFRGEDRVTTRFTHAELHALVSRTQQALAHVGVGPGDRVAAVMPNMPETIICMLAAVSLGAIWSSCSPDFGVQGVLDRFGQIEPKVLIACDGYFYGGKELDTRDKVARIAAQLPSLKRTVIVPYLNAKPDVASIASALTFPDFIAGREAKPIAYARMPFNHPLYIMFSSGTTGVPKCIVHGAGGTLLKHASEHLLHCDEKPGDRVFYFTTCGWMMWNWQVSALLSGATLILYDGSPFHPSPASLWEYAAAEKMTLFGTSAKYIDSVKKAGLEPGKEHDLSSIRLIASTGSPLAPESFDFVYRSVKADVHLASISGGTDILGCFVLGNPIAPVWRGEIQSKALGYAVDVFDEAGKPIRTLAGDLVCTRPFPSMPVAFWNDADGAKYRAAYFEKFPNIWCHGDWAEITAHDGIIIYGRSDATLNPGGVRIGTAEIYRQVEQFEDIQEAIAIGQDWDGDTRVILFVVMRPGAVLTDALQDRIRKTLRANCSPRHVPVRIIAVPDIPRTKSGKITELAVRDVVHGRTVKNREALANPEALAYFADLAELRT